MSSKFGYLYGMPNKDIECAKPFIKWVGGKGQLLTQLESLLPPNFSEWDNVTYVEPFVGGGAMLFYMLKTHPNIKHAVINDINGELVTCYKTVKTKCSELVKSLSVIEADYKALESEDQRKAMFLAKRDEYNTNRSNLTDIETTTLFFFLNRTCFNGLYRVNKQGLFNVPFGRAKGPTICDERTLYADSELLQNVDIMNGDFTGTFQKSKTRTLYYFDPPYRPLNATSNFNDYAKEAFGDNEQIRLKEFCDKIHDAKQSFMVSNSDCKQCGDPFFDELYSTYTIDRVSAARNVNANGAGRGKISEILIHNA